MTTLIIATRNAHKVEEIRGILGSEFQFLTLRDYPNAPAVVEDANTFTGNAAKKAVELARWLVTGGAGRAVTGEDSQRESFPGSLVLADDSGLEVDALKGAPGVHSARFAALDSGTQGNSSDVENNAKLLRLLQNVPADKRTARFRCVIALTPVFRIDCANASPVCSADERELQTEIFEGVCEGKILFKPAGAKGFGYDPLFVPDGFGQSFAELGENVKNRISHRAKALRKLREKFQALARSRK